MFSWEGWTSAHWESSDKTNKQASKQNTDYSLGVCVGGRGRGREGKEMPQNLTHKNSFIIGLGIKD